MDDLILAFSMVAGIFILGYWVGTTMKMISSGADE